MVLFIFSFLAIEKKKVCQNQKKYKFYGGVLFSNDIYLVFKNIIYKLNTYFFMNYVHFFNAPTLFFFLLLCECVNGKFCWDCKSNKIACLKLHIFIEGYGFVNFTGARVTLPRLNQQWVHYDWSTDTNRIFNKFPSVCDSLPVFNQFSVVLIVLMCHMVFCASSNWFMWFYREFTKVFQNLKYVVLGLFIRLVRKLICCAIHRFYYDFTKQHLLYLLNRLSI